MTQNSKVTVVVGDGWAALGAVSRLVQAQAETVWVAGSGVRLTPPLPGLAAGAGAAAWKKTAEDFDIDLGEEHEGCFIREFRNKAFREPAWAKAPTPEARQQVWDELLWRPERSFAGAFEARFSLSLGEIEDRIRAHLLPENNGAPAPAGLTRVEGMPLTEIRLDDGAVKSVVLGSGREIFCDSVIFADLWSELPAIAGLPKGLAFTRRRDPVGVLQAKFQHMKPVAADVLEGFFANLHRESGDDHDTRVWGGFSSDGMQSSWTLSLPEEQVEDNHQIAKKLRRMKSALDKMFVGTTWVPEGVSEFMANVRSEQVCFAERYLFSGGEEVTSPISLSGHSGLLFLTDGYGPSAAMQQVAAIFDTARPEAQAENMHASDISMRTAE